MSAPVQGRHRLFVCWQLNDPSDEGQIRDLGEALARQREIPGVLSVEFGPRTPQVDWEGPEYSFDYAMTLTFDTFESVRAYPPHPIHMALVEKVLGLGSNIRGFWLDPVTPSAAGGNDNG